MPAACALGLSDAECAKRAEGGEREMLRKVANQCQMLNSQDMNHRGPKNLQNVFSLQEVD